MDVNDVFGDIFSNVGNNRWCNYQVHFWKCCGESGRRGEALVRCWWWVDVKCFTYFVHFPVILLCPPRPIASLLPNHCRLISTHLAKQQALFLSCCATAAAGSLHFARKKTHIQTLPFCFVSAAEVKSSHCWARVWRKNKFIYTKYIYESSPLAHVGCQSKKTIFDGCERLKEFMKMLTTFSNAKLYFLNVEFFEFFECIFTLLLTTHWGIVQSHNTMLLLIYKRNCWKWESSKKSSKLKFLKWTHRQKFCRVRQSLSFEFYDYLTKHKSNDKILFLLWCSIIGGMASFSTPCLNSMMPWREEKSTTVKAFNALRRLLCS